MMRILYTLQSIVYFFKCDIVFLLSLIFPRRHDVWVFGAWFGEKYRGNSRYFFEYISAVHPEIKAVWLSKSDDIVARLRTHGYEVYDACSIKGIWMTLRAKYCFITHNMFDINEYACGGMTVIQLRRGTPFLKVAQDEHVTRCSLFQSLCNDFSLPLYKHNIDHWQKVRVIATSALVQSIYEKYFKLQTDQIAVTGYPRNDAIFHTHQHIPLDAQLMQWKKAGTRIALFVPHGPYDGFNAYLPKLDAHLKQLNVIMLVKPYVCKRGPEEELQFESKHIFYVHDDSIDDDIHNLLSYVDFFMTDYSSIFCDVLLRDIPLIFTPIETNGADVDFFYDYDEVTPGEKISRWSDLPAALRRAISQPDTYALHRHSVRELFNTYCDDHSCARVFEMIMHTDATLNRRNRY